MSRSVCVETDAGYVLSNSIASKRYWCKARGGRWQPETRTWLFPRAVAPDAAALLRRYRGAEYDSGSLAAHHEKQRNRRDARKEFYEEFERQKAEWAQTLVATDVVHRAVVPSQNSSLPSLGYVTAPDDNHPELKAPGGSTCERPRPGVLIYWFTTD